MWPGILVPFHCLLITGFAEGDPLGSLLGRWPLPAAGQYAFAVYLLQVPVIDLLMTATGCQSFSNLAEMAGLVSLLLLGAILVHHLVQQPLARSMQNISNFIKEKIRVGPQEVQVRTLFPGLKPKKSVSGTGSLNHPLASVPEEEAICDAKRAVW